MDNLFAMQMSPNQVKAVTNLGLAHVGDGVYELLCRSYLVSRGNKTVLKLHNDTVELVKAPAQARFADAMLPLLTQEELAWYRRGKNAHVHAVPKSATPAQYAQATGVEALFGALYLAGETARINEIFNTVLEALYGI